MGVANVMSWQREVDELNKRRELAQRMGGTEGIERQRKRGKLTVRERLDALGDPGSFREFMGLVGRATYEDGELTHFTPKASVEGTCTIAGRKVVVSAGDFTVRGGSSGGSQGGLITELMKTCPVIGDIRGMGLIMAVEMVSNQSTKSKFPHSFASTEKIRIYGLNNGLILYSRATAKGKYGEWFIVAPPLTITERECDVLVERLERTLQDLETDYHNSFPDN